MAVNPVTNKIYVCDWSGGSVTVIDGASQTATATVTVGSNPNNVAVNPVTNKIYVPNSGSNTVTVIDGATNATTTLSGVQAAAFVAVNPVTNKIYVGELNIATAVVLTEQPVWPIPLRTGITGAGRQRYRHPNPQLQFFGFQRLRPLCSSARQSTVPTGHLAGSLDSSDLARQRGI